MPMVSQDLIDNLLAEITRQQKVIEHQTALLKKQHTAALASTQLDGISTKASTTEILGVLDNSGEHLAHITKLMRQK